MDHIEAMVFRNILIYCIVSQGQLEKIKFGDFSTFYLRLGHTFGSYLISLLAN